LWAGGTTLAAGLGFPASVALVAVRSSPMPAASTELVAPVVGGG
jgi:hypothetical protein